MISLVIPTYRSPDILDICLKSAIENQSNSNEIIVVVDGFLEESKEVLEKHSDGISVLPFQENKGMQTALNFGVMNASNEIICIVNDDNVLCKDWDLIIEKDYQPNSVLTINQIEPTGPGMFNFPVKDFGRTPQEFKYEEFLKYEPTIRKDKLTIDGGIFPFAMSKKDYMAVGGFDTLYQSPFICDWDFFLKLELSGKGFYKTHNGHFYHFGSLATKNRKDVDKVNFKQSEAPAADLFEYKWGIRPKLYANNSHNPKTGEVIKGIKF